MKYVIILAFGLVAGFFAEEEYFRAPGSPETVASLSPLDKIGGAISNAFAPPKPEATVPPNELAGAASVDEELDYMVARRLGSLDGWSAFLAAHANGAYAQSARAEVERLRLARNGSAPPAAEGLSGASPDAETGSQGVRPAQPSPGMEAAALAPDAAPAPAAAEVSRGASPNAKPVDEAPLAALPSSATEVAALTADEVCKRDGDRLARLRTNFSSDEALRFANELGCEKLWPQLLALMKNPGNAVPAPAAAEVPNGASPEAKAASDSARPSSGTEVSASPSTVADASNAPSPGAKAGSAAVDPAPATESATLTPDEVCKRDEDRLARFRSNPSSDDALRFASELGCEKLRPQLMALIENLGNTAHPPAAAEVPNAASADAKATSEATAPAAPLAGIVVAALTPDEVCKRDEDRLARLRGDPSKDEAQRFAKELGCEKLRPQLRRLLESLGAAPPTAAAAEAPNGASPDAKVAREAVTPAPAPPSQGSDVGDASPVVAGIAAAQPAAQTNASDSAGRGVSDKLSSSGTAAPSSGASTERAEVEKALPAENAPAPTAAEASNGESPDAKPASDAAHPAQSPPAPEVANPSSVAAADAAAPTPAQPGAPQENAVRGVTDKEIVFGMAAPFSGASRELGRQMKIGVETAFNQINDAGGANGRLLRLMSADDGYEPTRTADAMQVLFDKDHVFGFIGNVGTPTAAVALPFALERHALFFGAFSGAGLLRRDPPDRYVFNYRASYAEETDAVVRYLVKVKRIQPKEIVVFAQQDLFGDSGYAGVESAVRSLPGDNPEIVRLNYKRNTVDVQDAVNELRSFKGKIKAVVMVASYRAAAKFIEKTRELYPSLIYTNVSFVGSTELAYELTLLGPRYAAGVIVTQVVPAINSYATIVLKYKEALAKYFPGEPPDYVSFEGYIDANILAEAVKRVGRDINTEKLVAQLEQMHDFDLELGTPVTFSSNEHQGSHKVWGTQLDETGHYQAMDLR